MIRGNLVPPLTVGWEDLSGDKAAAITPRIVLVVIMAGTVISAKRRQPQS